MNYKLMKAETHRRIKKASDNIDLYSKGHTFVDDAMKNKQLEEFDYYDTVEGMLNRFEHSLERWKELLETDGIDSKNMVATDIQQLLKEINY